MIAFLAITGCSVASRHNPQPDNYTVSFLLDNGPRFLSSPEKLYQTQFRVNVTNWSQNYDMKSCEVFLIVTNKDAVPVTDLETDNANNFAYGGWFNLDVENASLKSLGLQPIRSEVVANNWFNVMNTTSATARFIARTKEPVNPRDWRFVIMAIWGDKGKVSVLWTKVVSPS